MAKRSVGSAVISFGLVSIPVKFYIAASAENVSFCLLSPKGGKVNQVYLDAVTREEVARSDMKRGYAHSKNEVVVFTGEEIKKLEEENSGTLEILEFVASTEIDLLHVEKSYHLGPDKGGDKPYLLLSKALTKSKQYAIGQWCARGKQHLVVIRPYEGGLVLHQMYYADEVREFDNDTAKVQVRDVEIDMACKLIENLSSVKYDASKYKDTYKERVLKAVEAKVTGNETVVPKEPMKTNVGDLFEALKASLESSSKK